MALIEGYEVTPRVPDSSGSVRPVPWATIATTGLYNNIVMQYDDSGTRISAYGSFTVPQDYVSGPELVVEWVTNATAGVVVWREEHNTFTPGADSTDPASPDANASVQGTAPGVAKTISHSRIAMSATGIAAGDTIDFALQRDGTDVNDTLAAAAFIRKVYFEYQDA